MMRQIFLLGKFSYYFRMWYDSDSVHVNVNSRSVLDRDSARLLDRQGGSEGVRVISGTAKGRPLRAVPGVNTRPTSDKVKEAVFSMIGPYFDGGMVLDLYAGTGGLAIEALSRGMERAVLIDQDRKAIETIRDNVKRTGFADRVEIYRNDATRALSALAKRELRFDLVLLDPPYRLTNMDELMLIMQERNLLADEPVIVVEHDVNHTYEDQVGILTCTRRTEYGDSAVSIYRRLGE